MKSMIVTLTVAVACVFGVSAASAAAPAVATTNINLRAGPSTHFPVVTVVPAGAALATLGCLPGYTWCDVTFAGNRGWLAARYVRLAGPGVVITPAVAVPLAVAAPANADAQRAQVQANFEAADVNKDEQLDIGEFTTFVNLNADHNLGRAGMIRRFGMYGRAFGTMDANGDGVVSKPEIAARAQR